jgi:transposase-like protein
MANNSNYDDKFKASMVALLIAEGYPDKRFKLEEVARHAGVPSRTLRRWYLREAGAPPDNIVIQEKKALAQRLDELADKLVDVAFVVIQDVDEVTIQQVATSLGIIIDKKQLLEGKATERQEVTGEVTHAIKTIEVVKDYGDPSKSTG